MTTNIPDQAASWLAMFDVQLATTSVILQQVDTLITTPEATDAWKTNVQSYVGHVNKLFIMAGAMRTPAEYGEMLTLYRRALLKTHQALRVALETMTHDPDDPTAWALLGQIPADELMPTIEDLEKKWTVELTQAWIDSDQEKIDSLNALLAALGLVEAQIGDVADASRNWSSSGFGWISGPAGPVLPKGGGGTLSSRTGSGGGGFSSGGGDDDVSALMKKYPNLDWAGILAGDYGPGGLNSGSPTEAWVAAGLANPTVDVGTFSAIRAFQVLLDEGLDIANNTTLFDRFEIAVKLVTKNADLLQDSLFMGALGIIGISEEAIRVAQRAEKNSEGPRSTISEPIRIGENGDVYVGFSDRWADKLGVFSGDIKEGSRDPILGFAKGGVAFDDMPAMIHGKKVPEAMIPLKGLAIKLISRSLADLLVPDIARRMPLRVPATGAAGAGSSSGGVTINQDQAIILNGREIGRVSSEYQLDEYRIRQK